MSGWAALAAIGSKAIDSWSANYNAKKQDERTLELQRKQPSAQMQGYINAGLNPMLAYQNASFSNAATPVYSESTASSGSSVQRAYNETRSVDSTVDKIAQEITNLKTTNDQVTAVIDNLRVEYSNLVKQGYNLTEVGNQIRETVRKLKAEVDLVNQQSFSVEMTGRLNELELKAAQKFDNFGREFQQYKPIIDILKHLFRPHGGHQ